MNDLPMSSVEQRARELLAAVESAFAKLPDGTTLDQARAAALEAIAADLREQPEAVLATLAALDRDALDAANQRAAWTDQDAARAANEESFKARKALRALTAAQQPVQAVEYQSQVSDKDTGEVVYPWARCHKAAYDAVSGQPHEGSKLRVEYRVLYTAPPSAPVGVEADKIGFCTFSPDDRFYHAADNTWWRKRGDGYLTQADPPPSLTQQP